jgi:hypothetical protein
MPLALSCPCGARFEVDDSLAGQDVNCPDCRDTLTAPTPIPIRRRTSDLALIATVLTLFGAFTIVGTSLGVLLGLVALIQIRRQRTRLAGVGFSLFAILGGSVLTLITLFAVMRGELFGLDGLGRQSIPADQVDTHGPLEISEKDFTITRPNEEWGRVKNNRLLLPGLADIQEDLALLLANVSEHALVDVKVENNHGNLDTVLDTERKRLAVDLGMLNNNNDDDKAPPWRRHRDAARLGEPVEINRRALDPRDGLQGMEAVITVRREGQNWEFLVRVYRRQGARDGGRTYIVRGYTLQNRFEANEGELRRTLDSFRLQH